MLVKFVMAGAWGGDAEMTQQHRGGSGVLGEYLRAFLEHFYSARCHVCHIAYRGRDDIEFSHAFLSELVICDFFDYGHRGDSGGDEGRRGSEMTAHDGHEFFHVVAVRVPAEVVVEVFLGFVEVRHRGDDIECLVKLILGVAE